MQSQDRYGNTLPDTPLADPSNYTFSARIAATNQSFTSTANWTYYELPTDAILDRRRGTKLDAGTWQLQMTLLKDALPSNILDLFTGAQGGLEYYTLEVDILDGKGNAFPYHTGPIDSVQESHSLDDGAIVETLDISSYGIMQRTKKLYIPQYAYEPTTSSYVPNNTISLLAEARIALGPTAVLGTRIQIPGTFNTINATAGTNPATHANAIQVTTDSSFVTITRTYGVDYVIESSTGGAPAAGEPLYIRWLTAPPATYYVKFWQVQYAAILKHASVGTGPSAIRVPEGRFGYSAGGLNPKRRITDDFLTRVASAASASSITPEDTAAFINTNYLVAVTGFATDYLEWQKSDGTTEVRAISSTSGTGVITLAVAFTATPAAGDYIRVVTCEAVRAFDKFNQNSSNQLAAPYRFNVDAMGTNYPRAAFRVVPELGAVLINNIRHFDGTAGNWLYNSEYIYMLEDTANTGTTNIGNDNRIESAIYQLMFEEYGLMESSKFVVGTKLGAYAKNIQKSRVYMSDILAEITRDGMPPNGFVHDRPNGGLVVGAFSQSSAPTLKLNGISSVNITERPEPITMVTVISKADEPYLATHLFDASYTQASWTNPEYMLDGQVQDQTRYAQATTEQTVSFRIPSWMGPHVADVVDSIRVYGTQGVFRAQISSFKTNGVLKTAVIPGFGQFNQMGTNEFIEIPGEAVTDAITYVLGKDSNNKLHWLNDMYIQLVFNKDDLPAVALDPRVLEIQIYSKILAAWTAGLTPDTDTTSPYTTRTAPTNWTTVQDSTGAGPNYWQRTNGIPASWKYIPVAVHNRIQPFPQAYYELTKYRAETIQLTRISQTECRQTAERYLDEYLKQRVGYNVKAVLNPTIEPGDTVMVSLPDGTVKNLFVWSISDGGRGEDFEADYELIDYSA